MQALTLAQLCCVNVGGTGVNGLLDGQDKGHDQSVQTQHLGED